MVSSRAFVSKYDGAGELLWARMLGPNDAFGSSDVSADGLGNVYVSGSTNASLGSPNEGSDDAFVIKYNGAGELLWIQQVGSASSDQGSGVSADGLGNVYLAGTTAGSLGGPNRGNADAFVRRYDASGVLLWTRQFGSVDSDQVADVSADRLGNVYLTGTTYGSLGGPSAGYTDAFVSKYDASGTLLWTRQLGSADFDYGTGVAGDGLGNVYVSGTSFDSLGRVNVFYSTAFLSKYDALGTLLWTRQSSSMAGFDDGSGVSVDSLGHVYLSGSTWGSLGNPSLGYADAFVSTYDATGHLLQTDLFGSSESDFGSGVAADSVGNLYLSGRTLGSLAGPSVGRYDAFLSKFSVGVIPEPSTAALVMAALVRAGTERGRRVTRTAGIKVSVSH